MLASSAVINSCFVYASTSSYHQHHDTNDAKTDDQGRWTSGTQGTSSTYSRSATTQHGSSGSTYRRKDQHQWHRQWRSSACGDPSSFASAVLSTHQHHNFQMFECCRFDQISHCLACASRMFRQFPVKPMSFWLPTDQESARRVSPRSVSST